MPSCFELTVINLTDKFSIYLEEVETLDDVDAEEEVETELDVE